MHLQARHVVACVVSLGLPVSAYAPDMSDVTNQNVTIRFLPDSSDDTCAYSNSTNAPTFTTASFPRSDYCFNVAELFTGNTTRGFINQTEKGEWQESGIAWQLENSKAFDPQANYSTFLYRQAASNRDPGSYAPVRVNVWGGYDCRELDPAGGDALLNWYGFSCWNEVEGDCGTLPYNIASFTVQPGLLAGEKMDGTCLMFAELGAGVGFHQTFKAVTSVLVGVVAAMWLAS